MIYSYTDGMKRIIIADDHQVLLDGLETMLNADSEFEVIAKCVNGEQIFHRLNHEVPDILLLDINMPRMNGIEVTEQIRKKYPTIQIIALSMYKQPSYINRMIKLGARGYILKDEGKESILEALRTVSRGEKYLSQTASEIIRNQKINAPKIPGITTREKEVLGLLAEGLTSHEIAEKLFISYHTVQSHRKHLLRKFNVKNVSALSSMAKDMGII